MADSSAAPSLWWGLPFVGVLLSIALLPLLSPALWHHHVGMIIAAWTLAFVLPLAWVFGPGAAGHAVVHTVVGGDIPFIALLVALFTAAGGICVSGNLRGSPAVNVAIVRWARCRPA